ncbi:hypothetical protein NMY22_g13991 [Coprinellus aureogranulatus]|nr:hypothetical protein NMY22_g13991 [Coprinellus aureogranulatus]
MVPDNENRRHPPATGVSQDSAGHMGFSHLSGSGSDVEDLDAEGEEVGDETESGLDPWNFSEEDWAIFDRKMQTLHVVPSNPLPSHPQTTAPYASQQQLSSVNSGIGTASLRVPDPSTTSPSPSGPLGSGLASVSSCASSTSYTFSDVTSSSTAHSLFPSSPHGLSLDGSPPSHSGILPPANLDPLPTPPPNPLTSCPSQVSFPHPQSSHVFPSPDSLGPDSLSLLSQHAHTLDSDMASLLSNPGGSSLFHSNDSQISFPSLSHPPSSSHDAQPPFTFNFHHQDPVPNPPYSSLSDGVPGYPSVSNSLNVPYPDLRSPDIAHPSTSHSQRQNLALAKLQSSTAVVSGTSVAGAPSSVGAVRASTSPEGSSHLTISMPSGFEPPVHKGLPPGIVGPGVQTASIPPPTAPSVTPNTAVEGAAPPSLNPPPLVNASQSPAVGSSRRPSAVPSPPHPSSDDSRPIPEVIEGEGCRRRSTRGAIPSKRNGQQQQIGANAASSSKGGSDEPRDAFWFTLAVEHLRSFDLGEEWTELVDKWGLLEASMGYGKGTKIDSAAALGITFSKWWHSLQHSFRVSKGPFPRPVFSPPQPSDSSDPWASLRKPGEDGFVVVMMLLGWWGHAATTTTSEWEDDSRPAWHKLVSDVKEVIGAMSGKPPAPPQPTRKRSAAKENIAPGPKSNKRRKRY